MTSKQTTWLKKFMIWLAWLALCIVIISACGIVLSFVTEHIQASGFFDDKKRITPLDGGPDPWYDWGPRHYWYFWTLFLMFILSLIRTIGWCVWFWDEHNGNQKEY